MKRELNEVQLIFSSSMRTAPQKNLVARIDKLYETLAAMSYKGLSKVDRNRLYESGLEAIKSDLVIDMENERMKISDQLKHLAEKHEHEYEQDLPRHSFELDKFERKFPNFPENYS